MADKEKNIPGGRKHEQGMVWGWDVVKTLGVQAAFSAPVRKEWGDRDMHSTERNLHFQLESMKRLGEHFDECDILGRRSGNVMQGD